MSIETNRIAGTAVAAEFVPNGDPHRDDKDDEPRTAGVYLTILLDDQTATVVGGRVVVEFRK